MGKNSLFVKPGKICFKEQSFAFLNGQWRVLEVPRGVEEHPGCLKYRQESVQGFGIIIKDADLFKMDAPAGQCDEVRFNPLGHARLVMRQTVSPLCEEAAQWLGQQRP